MGSHYQWTGKPKRAYKTAEEAESHRKELEDRDNYSFDVYQCHCKMYHVGHKQRNGIIRKSEKRLIAVEEAMVGQLIGVLKRILNT